MKRLLIYLFLLFAFTSCFEEDEMVEPHDSGDLTTAVVQMTGAYQYQYQVYYSFNSDSSIQRNLLSEWDLGFETADSGWHVVLNTSKMMLAGNTGETDFDAVSSSSGVETNFDVSSGNLDSTAIGDWYSLSDDSPVSNGYVYIIERGTDETGSSVGEKKISLDLEDEDTYILRYANLDGTEEQTVTIPKDTTVNHVCFSFENGIVAIEPPKEEWDLWFTKYSTMLTSDGEPYPYLVTGVLLNPYKTYAVLDTIYSFDDYTYEIVETMELSTQQDVIGYDWKEYDFNDDHYATLSDNTYILKSSVGYFYKMRFVDFYNNTGDRGYPTFEFLRL